MLLFYELEAHAKLNHPKVETVLELDNFETKVLETMAGEDDLT